MARNERKRASNIYIDAQAKTAKARIALDAALARYVEASGAEEAARDACEAQELPVGNPPAALELTERK